MMLSSQHQWMPNARYALRRNMHAAGKHTPVTESADWVASRLYVIFLPPRGGAGPMALMLWLDLVI
jgi:hypothetical protein